MTPATYEPKHMDTSDPWTAWTAEQHDKELQAEYLMKKGFRQRANGRHAALSVWTPRVLETAP